MVVVDERSPGHQVTKLSRNHAVETMNIRNLFHGSLSNWCRDKPEKLYSYTTNICPGLKNNDASKCSPGSNYIYSKTYLAKQICMYFVGYGHADSHYHAYQAHPASRNTVNANCQTVQLVFMLQSAHLEAHDRHISTGEKSCRLPSKSLLESSLPSCSPHYISN